MGRLFSDIYSMFFLVWVDYKHTSFFVCHKSFTPPALYKELPVSTWCWIILQSLPWPNVGISVSARQLVWLREVGFTNPSWTNLALGPKELHHPESQVVAITQYYSYKTLSWMGKWFQHCRERAAGAFFCWRITDFPLPLTLSLSSLGLPLCISHLFLTSTQAQRKGNIMHFAFSALILSEIKVVQHKLQVCWVSPTTCGMLFLLPHGGFWSFNS